MNYFKFHIRIEWYILRAFWKFVGCLTHSSDHVQTFILKFFGTLICISTAPLGTLQHFFNIILANFAQKSYMRIDLPPKYVHLGKLGLQGKFSDPGLVTF